MAVELRTAEAGGEFGAYGLRLENATRARSLLVAAPASWPRVRIRRRVGPGSGEEWITDSQALLRLQNGGEIALDRERGDVTFVLPRRVRTPELVHPLLAPVGSVMAHWLGRESFHAGAFVVDGRAWGLVGDRGLGKSTTAASLALRGVQIVADDLLVVGGGQAFAGPRAIDLREEAAERLGVGEPLGLVGARTRWRMPLPPVAPEVTLAGWIFLAWGERTEVRNVPPSERLVRLYGNRGVTLPPRDPATMIELASLPTLELTRPNAWDSAVSSVDRLLDAAAG